MSKRVSICKLEGDTLTIIKDVETVGEAVAFVNGDAGMGTFHVVKWHLSQENGEVEVKTTVKALSTTVYNPRAKGLKRESKSDKDKPAKAPKAAAGLRA